MLRIAICDDEEKVLDDIEKRLINFLNTHNIKFEITKFQDGRKLLEFFQSNNVDLILLDIEMPEMSGDEISANIRCINDDVMIIFITSYDEMVYSVIKHKPFRFIRKSKLDIEFVEALEDVIKTINAKNQCQLLLTTDGDVLFELSEIIYFESMGHSLYCFTQNKKYEIKATMTKVEELLALKGFIRTHKSYLVNVLYIFSINKNKIELKVDDIILPLSKHRVDVVKQKLLMFSK